MELVVLKDPTFVSWLLAPEDASGLMLKAQVETKRLVIKLNQKPIKIKCGAVSCPCQAT